MPKYTAIMSAKENIIKSNSAIFSTKDAVVMGILNLTEDSFFDGGKYSNKEEIIARCKTMLDEGATMIDIGAQSSRPGATQISSKEELKKLIPIIKLLKNNFPNILISVDTFWSNTAKECALVGTDVINDISAGEMDKEMFPIIAELNIPYIMMHMKGNPQNMQNHPEYNNIVDEVSTYFSNKIEKLNILGFNKIIIYPGFGFGKTLEHNYQILNDLDAFKYLKCPILTGISRKSMIYKLLDTTADNALNGTTITNTMALLNGADILRVHDVKQAIECIKITTFAKNNC
jgi:dihydropteroate synthase